MKEKQLKEIIHKLRINKGYTQQELGHKLHISEKTVSKIENGIIIPDINLLLKIAKVLDGDSKYLLELRGLDNSNTCYQETEKKTNFKKLLFGSIGMSLGVSVVVLNTLNKLDIKDGLSMLGIGIFCLSLSISFKD